LFRSLLASGVTALVFANTLALADGNVALSQSLFQQAKGLMAAGNYAEACPKFEESFRLEAATGTLLNLAVCHEKAGQTATAWAEYTDAAARARREGRSDREKFAADHARALEPVLARLTLAVPPATREPQLEVRVDGTLIGQASWGTAVPFDPGKHAVEASAPAKQRFSTEVELGAGQSRTVEIPTLHPAASTKPVAAKPGASGTSPTDSRTPPAKEGAATGGSRVAAYVVGGIGVVGLGVGTYFGLRTFTKTKESDQACTPECTQAGVDAMNAAKTSAWISNIGFGVGILGVGIGTYLLLRPADGGQRNVARITPLVGPQGGGVVWYQPW
jgi:hypothetical protein